MTIWYTADTHFGHEKVIDLCKRPFKSASHMDGALIENMWKVVKPDDTLCIIGDFAYGPHSKEPAYLEGIFHQLPGAEKHLVIGNHDSEIVWDLPWKSVAHISKTPGGSEGVKHVMCHYPMMTWEGARKGALQLFGHVHDRWRGSRNAVNVGVDVWDYAPVSFDQISRRARSLPKNKHWGDVERVK